MKSIKLKNINTKPFVMPNKNYLYITDLDGTLLNSEKELSPRTKYILNRQLKNDILFSVATARTPATITNILKELNIKLPIICMNGSAIYDIKQNKYLMYYQLEKDIYIKLLKIFDEFNSNCFIHLINDNRLYVYYQDMQNSAQQEFYEERKNLALKTYIKGEPQNTDNIIFLMLLDELPVINKIYAKIQKLPFYNELSVSTYEDIYNKGYGYLEIYGKSASKKAGLDYLKSYTKAEKTFSFGDNANDIPMLLGADMSFAVLNASNSAKDVASYTLKYTNNQDAIARYLKNFNIN